MLVSHHSTVIRQGHPSDAAFLSWVVIESCLTAGHSGYWDLILGRHRSKKELARVIQQDIPHSLQCSSFRVMEVNGNPVAAVKHTLMEEVQIQQMELLKLLGIGTWQEPQIELAFKQVSSAFQQVTPEPVMNTLELEYLAVLPSFRRLGIASKLIDDAINQCSQHEAKNISILVSSKNHSAIKCYQRAGFLLQSKHKNKYFTQLTGHDGIDFWLYNSVTSR